MLGERGGQSRDNIKLINLTTRFALENSYSVIIEGILHNEHYGDMLRGLTEDYPENHIYYIDVSLEETLIRHHLKPNKDEFGEEEMTKWYRAKDYLNFKNEVIIPETITKQEIIDLILQKNFERR